MATYCGDGAEESYIHIKEVDDGIYAGAVAGWAEDALVKDVNIAAEISVNVTQCNETAAGAIVGYADGFNVDDISNINDIRVDKKALRFSCPSCKKALKGKNKWRFKNNWLRSEMNCENCGIKYRTMVSFKQTYDDVISKRRILPIIKTKEEENVAL